MCREREVHGKELVQGERIGIEWEGGGGKEVECCDGGVVQIQKGRVGVLVRVAV